METLDLTPFFTTKAQANDFSARLATISEKVYENNFSLENTALDQLGIRKKDALLKLLHDHTITADDAGKLKEFIAKIQKNINELPVISITIAFEPNAKTLTALSDWFMFNLKRQILLDITLDQNLIAGAKINYKGKFMDCSSKPLFDKLLQEILTNTYRKNVPQQAPPSHNETQVQNNVVGNQQR